MKRIFTILVALFLTVSLYAQAPSKMSYQAVIRNSSNQLVTSQTVGMKISILQGSAVGTPVYVETQTPTTNANGLVTVEIGGGIPLSGYIGAFSTIDWSAGPYFIKTETDPEGGINYTITGTSQLLSVPYALYAKTAETVLGGINDFAWSLKGNSGTSEATNFLGTTDNVPLMFKVNNQLAGKIDPSTYNVSLGYHSLQSNTTGYSNVALGTNALQSNTIKSNLVAIGDSALFNNGIGVVDNEEAQGNTAVGSKALYSNETGFNNTANGSLALYSNVTGNNNTAMGLQALQSNTTGYSNVALGTNALQSNTFGYDLVAIGESALFNNSRGVFVDDRAQGNTAVGAFALFWNTGGRFCTANGNRALMSNTTGVCNTANGIGALEENTIGNFNTCIGAYANTSVGNLQGASAFGASAIVPRDNAIVLGANVADMAIGGYSNWYNLSDGRFKEDIKENVPGLAFITRLRPITYWVNTDKLLRHLTAQMNDSIAKRYLPSAKEHSKDMEYTHTGFVAQEVEATAKEIGYTFDGVNAPKNSTDNYSIAYSQFVPSLVKAIQELNVINDGLKLSVEELKAQNEKLIQRIEKLEAK